MARAAAVENTADSRERILEAALEAFAEHGYEGAKTREIAARAGVNLGLLQYYFGGKAKLWRAAVDRAFGQLRDGLEAVLAATEADDLRGRLRQLIRGHVLFVARKPEFVRIMHDEGKRRGPRMRWMVDRHVQPLYTPLRELIVESQRGGLLPADVDPVHFLYILAGSVGVFFHQAEECRRLSGIDPFDADVVEAHVRAVEHVFLGPAIPEDSP
jgi:TetR/AcrR family transcriptional regulator